LLRGATGQLTDQCPIPGHHCFLLGTAPALEFAFYRKGIITSLEILYPQEDYGQASGRVTWERATLVLGDTAFEIIGMADIILFIAATQNVGVECHRVKILALAGGLRQAQPERGGTKTR